MGVSESVNTNRKEILVGRDPELQRLSDLLDQALGGRGRVCFVSGEPGAGKTALVTAFAHGAVEQHAELVTVSGACDAQTGEGDAYLPFREILGILAGSEPKEGQAGGTKENRRRLKELLILTGEALVDIGPDLIGLFVPGASLVAKAGQFMVEKSEWSDKLRERLKRGDPASLVPKEGLDQNQIFEQVTRVLQALSRKKPILLVVEDLQWADAASIGLLFRLGRRVTDSRILLVGTYRPNDVALGRDGDRHPLVPVLTEMKRYWGDVVVDLDSAQRERGRAFVDAYLDAELNCLDSRFREALYEHTGGHPLFTVELVGHLRDEGNLLLDDAGCWTEGTDLDWSDLPSRVEGVIEERIGRLTADLRDCLTVAAVEGEHFTAEVIARIESRDVRDLVRQLSGELHRAHHLVESQGIERVATQRLSIYRFSHSLMQAYLYADLDEVQAAYLHEDVGLALEALYGEQAPQIAIQLARHFELAGLDGQASRYLRIAAEQAAARYANKEALSLVDRALPLVPGHEAGERIGLLLLREQILGLLGDRQAQERDLATLHDLIHAMNEPGLEAEIQVRQAAFYLQTGRFAEAAEAAEASAIGLNVK